MLSFTFKFWSSIFSKEETLLNIKAELVPLFVKNIGIPKAKRGIKRVLNLTLNPSMEISQPVMVVPILGPIITLVILPLIIILLL
jgi:hypothetical protein